MFISKKQFGRTSLLAFAAFALLPTPGRAHVRQRVYLGDTDNRGQESIVGWKSGTPVKISMHSFSGFVGTGSTLTSLNSEAARTIVGASMTKWLEPFEGMVPSISLDLSGNKPYAIASGCEYDPDNSSQIDNINNFLFSSKLTTSCSSSIDVNTGVIGVTRARFRTDTGDIFEVDTQFDDRTFKFTDSGPNNLVVTPKVINLYDVVTHEFGHFLGLDHSASRTSTMLYSIAADLKNPKPDDRTGLLSLYPPATPTTAATTAALSGSVTDDGEPVFGAVVYALDARTLAVSTSDFTNLNGAFDFCAVKAGPQLIYANSYLPFGTNVHSYYSGKGSSTYATTDGCYNAGCLAMTRDVHHTFFSEAVSGSGYVGGLSLKPVLLKAGQTATYVNLTANTSDQNLTDVPGVATLGNTTASRIDLDAPRAALLSSTDLPRAESAAVVGTDAYRFTVSTPQTIRISTASLNLYSRLKLTLALYSSATSFNSDISSSCASRVTADVDLAQDPYLVCSLAAGDYIVKVSGTTAGCDDIPGNSRNCEIAGETASTARALYLITVVENSKVGSSQGNDSDLATTSLAASRYGNLPTCGLRSKSVSKGSSGGGCCGTLRTVGSGPRGPETLLLSFLLNPALWFGLIWFGKLRHSRRPKRAEDTR